MGDFETSKSRVSLDASNITSHGLAVLIVKSVSIEDEGIYKCDVTYIQGACPSLTYTKLFTLGKKLEKFYTTQLSQERKETSSLVSLIACPNQRQLVYFAFCVTVVLMSHP